MKRNKTRLFIIFIIQFILIYNPCFSQTKTRGFLINIEAGFASPLSGVTFNKYWFPAINFSLKGLKQINNHFYAGPGFDYNLFAAGDWLRLDSRMNILNPNISASYNFILFKKIVLNPGASIGYSWIVFTNSITPAKYLKPYNESGFSISPGLSAGYLFKKGITLGLSCSINEIFRRFGEDNSNMYENRKEADHISYLSLKLHLDIKIL